MEKFFTNDNKNKIIQIHNNDINFNKIELIETHNTCCIQRTKFSNYLVDNIFFDDKNFNDIINIENNDFSNKKHIGIVYSGGWDSNYLMIKSLMNGDIVTPICFKYNDDFVRHYNLSLLKNRFPRQIKKTVFLNGLFGDISWGLEFHGISQQPCIHFSLGFLKQEIYNNLDELQIGYILNDCACSFQKELQDIYYGTCKTQWKKDKIVPLIYPIIQENKSMIINSVSNWTYRHNCPLISITCELPTVELYSVKDGLLAYIEECKCCDSCKKIDNFTNFSVRNLIVKIPYNQDNIKQKI